MSILSTTYWKMGSGNCFSGGFVGAMTTHQDGSITWMGGAAKPVGAADITEAEYQGLLAAMEAQWPAEIASAEQALEDSKAALEANFASAKAKLMAGQPLTEAEAEALGGSL